MALIGKIRQYTGFLFFIIALAIVGFLLMDIMNGASRLGGGSALVAGKLNGREVSMREYETRYTDALERAQQSGQGVTDEQRYSLRESSWDQYVKDMILEDETSKLGIGVTVEEMTNLITSPDAHPSIKGDRTFANPNTGQFDPAKVSEYLNLISSDDNTNPQIASAKAQWIKFEEFLKRDQAKTKYLNLIKKGIYTPTWLAEKLNKEKNSKAAISFVKIPYSSIPDDQVTVTDADLKNYLNANRSKYMQEASRDIKYIVFDANASAKDSLEAKNSLVNILGEFTSTNADSTFIANNSDSKFNGGYLSKAEIKSTLADSLLKAGAGTILGPVVENGAYNYYKVLGTKMVPDSVQARHILIKINQVTSEEKAKAKLDSIKALIDGGASFDDLAKQLSEDDGSKEKGGDLGFFKKGTMVPEFNDACFYELEEGQSKMVKTRFGWHLINLTKKGSPTANVKLAILSRDISPSDETTNKAFADANTFASMNRNMDSFTKSAEEKKYPVKAAMNLLENGYTIAGLGANADIVLWAHQHKVGDISNVFSMENKYIVAAVTGKKDKGIASLEDRRTELEAAVKREKKAELIKNKIGTNNDLNAIAAANGVTVEIATDVAFAGTSATLGREPKVQAAVFKLSNGQVSAPVGGEAGVYVVRLDTVTDAPATDAAALKNQESTNYRNRADFGVLNALKEAADLKDLRNANRKID